MNVWGNVLHGVNILDGVKGTEQPGSPYPCFGMALEEETDPGWMDGERV